jgi:hypothetical protein
MGINHRYGYDQKRTRRYGALFSSIDFELSEELTVDDYQKKSEIKPIGAFCIGNKKFNVTFKELQRILETAQSAEASLRKKYRMGQMRY